MAAPKLDLIDTMRETGLRAARSLAAATIDGWDDESESAAPEGTAGALDIRRRAMEALAQKRAQAVQQAMARLVKMLDETLQLTVHAECVGIVSDRTYPDTAYTDIDGVRFYVISGGHDAGILFACETPADARGTAWIEHTPAQQVEGWADIGELLARNAGAVQ